MIPDQGIDIEDYREMDETLPFARFPGVMSKHHVEEWNQYWEKDAEGRGAFSITIYFEDGKEFAASGDTYPGGFEDF